MTLTIPSDINKFVDLRLQMEKHILKIKSGDYMRLMPFVNLQMPSNSRVLRYQGPCPVKSLCSRTKWRGKRGCDCANLTVGESARQSLPMGRLVNLIWELAFASQKCARGCSGWKPSRASRIAQPRRTDGLKRAWKLNMCSCFVLGSLWGACFASCGKWPNLTLLKKTRTRAK